MIGARRYTDTARACITAEESPGYAVIVIAMWFAPETKAPITLLELGLFARSGKVIVGCPDGFWRKGNVEIVCARFGCELTSDCETFVARVVGLLHSHQS